MNFSSNLCSLLLSEHFGPVASSVFDELKCGPKSLKLLMLAFKNQPTVKIKRALNILIFHDFVQYGLHENGTCEYRSVPENILLILRYSKFIAVIGKKYGREAEFVIEELLSEGKLTVTNLILATAYSLTREHANVVANLSTIKTVIGELVRERFIGRVECMTQAQVPSAIVANDSETYAAPQVDLKRVQAYFNRRMKNVSIQGECYWRVNVDRFHREIRDELMVNAISSRFDNHAGIVMKHLLNLAYSRTTKHWNPNTNPISMMLINESLATDPDGAYAAKYASQYTKIIQEDSCKFLEESVEYSGGVIVCIKNAVNSLTNACISQIIQQKFGGTAVRIFRLIQEKKYLEMEQIREEALIADKEAKQIAFKLLEANFVQLQELRKPVAGAASSGLNKAFFLFYIDFDRVVKMVIGMCHKSICNIIIRRKKEQEKIKHIVEKKKQADILSAALKEQGSTDNQIQEMINMILSKTECNLFESLEKITTKLECAELQLDEMSFLLELYLRFNTNSAISKVNK